MLLFYIDESGTGLKDQRSPYFILCAFSIAASDWAKMDSQVAALKRHLVSWAKPEDFEIKGRDMRRGEKFFRGQDWETRIEAFHLVDMRSDMHSSVQDRRLIDAYREWINSRMGCTRLVELPWFGFSAFYAGLQLADFAAYLMDFTSNELERDTRDRPLYEISARIRDRVSLIRIP